MNATTTHEPTGEHRSKNGSEVAGFALGRLLAQALEFVGWIVVARSGALDEVGAIALAILGTRYAGFVADWGAQFIGSRDVALDGPDRARTSALVRARERATAAATLLAIGGLWLLSGPAFTPFAGLVLARGLTRDWIALGQRRTGASVAPPLAQAATTLLGLIVLSPLTGAPIAYGLGGMVGLALSLALNPVPRQRVSIGTSSVEGWYVISGVAGLIYTTADSAMLGLFRDNAEVAVYSSLYRLPNAWLMLVGLVVGGLVPLATRQLQGEWSETRALIRRLRLLAVAGAAIVVVATPVALWSLVPIFGESYRDGITPLAILMVATAIVTIGAPFQVLVIARGADRRNALVMAVAAAANIGANIVAIPLFGMTGAAVTTLATQALPAAFYLWSARMLTPGGDQALRSTKPA